MKDIILRKAKPEQYELYKKFHSKVCNSLVYGYSDKSNVDPNSIIDFLGLGIPEPVLPEEELKEYLNNVNKIFFIVSEDASSRDVIGYIEADKDHGLRKVDDLVISDTRSINETTLSKVFDSLAHETKAKGVYFIVHNSRLRKMLESLGFRKSGCCYEKCYR